MLIEVPKYKRGPAYIMSKGPHVIAHADKNRWEIKHVDMPKEPIAVMLIRSPQCS